MRCELSRSGSVGTEKRRKMFSSTHTKGALVAEQVDATDLKSVRPKGLCRFESGPGHQPTTTPQLVVSS